MSADDAWIVPQADDAEVAAFDAAHKMSDDIAHEAHRIRVREAARDLVAREKAGDERPLDLALLGQILARPAEPPHRIAELVPRSAGTVVVAQRKTGKTTLLLNLARALIEGGDFLGRFEVDPVNGRVAILNFEVSGAQMARWADEAGIDHDRLVIVNLRGQPNPFTHPGRRAVLAEDLVLCNVKSLIVDPFGRAYTGKSQNDNGEVAAWLNDLDAFARSEAIVEDLFVAVHAGWDGERTRGASALEDWADSVITMVRDKDDDGLRYLRAIGRDVEVEEDRLDYDPATRALTLAGAGSRKRAAKTKHLTELLPAVVALVRESPGMTGYKIGQGLRADGVAFSKGEESKAAVLACERGLLRSEPGPRNSRLYFPAADLPRPPYTSLTGKSSTSLTSPIGNGEVDGDVTHAPPPQLLLDACAHGEPGGDQPDPFVNDLLRCPECRAEAMAS